MVSYILKNVNSNNIVIKKKKLGLCLHITVTFSWAQLNLKYSLLRIIAYPSPDFDLNLF